MYDVIQTYSDLMGSDDLPGSASEKSWGLWVHTCCPDLYIDRDFCESNRDVIFDNKNDYPGVKRIKIIFLA